MNGARPQTLQTVLRGLLLAAGLLAGNGLTWSAAFAGFARATRLNCHRPSMVATARLRVKAARDASAEYMMDNESNCPRGLDELVSKKYLDPHNLQDPWGKPLIFHCPGTSDSDSGDVSSAGPDRLEGTPDDIRSWDFD